MITALIVVGSVSAYLAGMLLTARWVYGAHRRRFIGKWTGRRHEWGMKCYTALEAAELYEKHNNGRDDGLFLAWPLGFVWPVVPPLFLVGRLRFLFIAAQRWITRTARRSPAEIAEEREERIRQLERANAELERQLRIGDHR